MVSSRTSEAAEAEFPPVALLEGAEATLREAALSELRERTLGGGRATSTKTASTWPQRDPTRPGCWRPRGPIP